MPYVENRSIEKPSDPNARVWRYMDLTKFVSLLHTRALYFPSIDTLAQQDFFEGKFPKAVLNRFRQNLDVMQANFATENDYRMTGNIVKTSIIQYEYELRYLFVSCWHQNDYESAAMRSLYAPRSAGIAVISTFKNLCEALRDSPSDIYIGHVSYLDFLKDEFAGSEIGAPADWSVAPAFWKYKSFDHEREVRAVFKVPWSISQETVRAAKKSKRHPLAEAAASMPSGKSVPCDLDALVEEVRLAPDAPDWYYDVIRALLDKFGLRREPQRSQLGGPAPHWRLCDPSVGC